MEGKTNRLKLITSFSLMKLKNKEHFKENVTLITDRSGVKIILSRYNSNTVTGCRFCRSLELNRYKCASEPH